MVVVHPPEVKNIDFSKILGMALPGVENIPTSLEIIFKLSRGPQRPYIKKSEKYRKLIKLIIYSLFPLFSP